MDIPFLHPQARPQDRGRLRGSLQALEPFLFLGLILPEDPGPLPGPLPPRVFRWQAGPLRTCLGYLLLPGPDPDPDLARSIAELQAGRAWRHPAFLALPRPRHAGPGCFEVVPEPDFPDALAGSWRLLSRAVQSLDDSVVPIATEDPGLPPWLDLERDLLQAVPEPRRPFQYLEARLVLSWQEARHHLSPTSLEATRPHRLLPVTGEVDRPGSEEAADDLWIRFKDRGWGWIDLVMRLQGRHHEVSLSDAFDPLGSLVDWMEACLDESRPALVGIDPEGGTVFLALRPCATPGRAIFQYLEGYRGTPRGQAEIPRRPFVAAFLDAMEHPLAHVLDLEEWDHAVQAWAWGRPGLSGTDPREGWRVAYRDALLHRVRAVRARMAGLGAP